jgi:prepilin-type N-terminal cleavage/methylation domain-containing protein
MVCGPRSAVSSARGASGFSLVELLVATVIIVIVFISWLRISNFQAIRKESLRRAAIEKAAGYLDYMVDQGGTTAGKAYTISFSGTYSVGPPSDPSDASYRIPPLFEESDPIGYVLRVVQDWPHQANWPVGHGWPNSRWAVIQLYDEHGVSVSDAGRPFSTMSVFMQ